MVTFIIAHSRSAFGRGAVRTGQDDRGGVHAACHPPEGPHLQTGTDPHGPPGEYNETNLRNPTDMEGQL